MSDEVLDITAAIRQRLAWDIAQCDEIDELWEELGLVPPSTDVAEIAHEESHMRMETVEPLSSMADIYMILTADIISTIMAKQFKDQHGEYPGEVERSVMKVQNQEVIRGAVYPILAHLLETGMIQFGPTVRTGTAMRLI